jgi:chromosome segregation ATPase
MCGSERGSASHVSTFMKLASLVILAVGSTAFPVFPSALAANDPSLAAEVAALEKKLAATRDELAEVKTALAISKSETEAALARARNLISPDSQVDALRGQVRVLERDLQSATSALKRVAADKAATEAALFAANEALVSAGRKAIPPRGQIPAGASGAAVADPKVSELQAELGELRSRLTAAEKNVESREAELAKMRAAVAAAESRPAIPPEIAQELADLRARIANTRDTDARVRDLEKEKSAATTRLAEAEARLASVSETLALRMKELEGARLQASRASELEARLRQLESEKSAGAATAAPAANPDELARVNAARLEAEGKLSTVLRSFTLLTKERDELRARLAELTKSSGETEKR